MADSADFLRDLRAPGASARRSRRRSARSVLRTLDSFARRQDSARVVGPTLASALAGASPGPTRRVWLRRWAALYHWFSSSCRATEISPRVRSGSVRSVVRRASTRRSLRSSVLSVLRLERHRGRRESRFGCGQRPCYRAPTSKAGSLSIRMAAALYSAVPDFESTASIVRKLVGTSSGWL